MFNTQSSYFFSKVYLRAISKNAKKKEKTFVLRDIDTSKVLLCSDLKEIIRAQLYEDISCDDFDVGVISNTSVVRVRTKKDLSELWSDVKNAKTKAVLWCDDLIDKSNQKCKSGETVDSEDDKPSKKRLAKVRLIQTRRFRTWLMTLKLSTPLATLQCSCVSGLR